MDYHEITFYMKSDYIFVIGVEEAFMYLLFLILNTLHMSHS